MNPRTRVPILALILALGTLAAADATAQESQREGFQVEPSFRATSLLGGAFPHGESGPGFQLAARRMWPSGLSLGAGGGYTEPVDLDLDGDRRQRIMREQRYYAEVRYQEQSSRVVQPYAALRSGLIFLESKSVADSDGSGVVGEVLLGTEIWATERFGFHVNAASSTFSLSGFFPDGSSGQAFSFEAGVSYFFGSSSYDTDGDGVDDDRDACPGTPGGLEVDARGCLPDGDDDGIADVRDACSGTPAGAEVDGRGCARDEDRDGVPDSRDRCAGTPAGQPVDEQGCIADADGDGVADGQDACPDTPSGSDVDGRGCSLDADGDGVSDAQDRCPGTMRDAETDESGCSDVQEGIRQGRLTVTGLPFRFRDVQVNMDFAERLQQMGRELSRNRDLRLEIRVYTDTIGPTSYNQQMSQRLAGAARDFLLRNYPELARARLNAVGMGEADSRDAGEQAGGSRVEFIIRGRGQGGGSP